MARCPFARKKKDQAIFCKSPDNPGYGLDSKKQFKFKTNFGTDQNQCLNNMGRDCLYNFDENNKRKYGPKAPLFCERIWVNPLDCRQALISSNLVISGRVIENQWPPPKTKQIMSTLELKKVKYCINRWCHNLHWQDTGAYELLTQAIDRFGQYDGCLNDHDINDRYNKLDMIFEQVKKDGRLCTRQEIAPANFREMGGIIVHIGPENELYIGGGGIHRFAMAYLLSLPLIPAQVGYVHNDAIPYLDLLRRPD